LEASSRPSDATSASSSGEIELRPLVFNVNESHWLPQVFGIMTEVELEIQKLRNQLAVHPAFQADPRQYEDFYGPLRHMRKGQLLKIAVALDFDLSPFPNITSLPLTAGGSLASLPRIPKYTLDERRLPVPVEDIPAQPAQPASSLAPFPFPSPSQAPHTQRPASSFAPTQAPAPAPTAPKSRGKGSSAKSAKDFDYHSTFGVRSERARGVHALAQMMSHDQDAVLLMISTHPDYIGNSDLQAKYPYLNNLSQQELKNLARHLQIDLKLFPFFSN